MMIHFLFHFFAQMEFLGLYNFWNGKKIFLKSLWLDSHRPRLLHAVFLPNLNLKETIFVMLVLKTFRL
jgi:hypothetical protein